LTDQNSGKTGGCERPQRDHRRAGALGRRYRQSHGLAVADLVIAATAIELDAQLATANTRHFPMFRGLTPPYE
jgi:predicted nucleic acid-binding protein